MKTTSLLLFFLFFQNLSFSQTINIELIDSKLSDQEIEQIQNTYVLQRNYYESVFGKSNSLVDLKLYGDFDKYKNYQQLISKTSRSNSGFHSKLLSAAVVFKKKGFLYTINHELSHLMVEENFSNCPKWLDEGLAEYFEYFEFKDNQYQLRIQFHKIKRLAKWLDKNKINVKKFLRFTNDAWNSKNSKPDYYSSSLSYGLVLFLMEKHPEFIKDLIVDLSSGKPVIKLLKSKYPGGFEAFETNFMEFIQYRDESSAKIIRFE